MTQETGTTTPAAYAGLEGREAAAFTRVLLVLTAGAAGFIGLVLYATSGSTERHFAWTTVSPVTAVLLGAGFVGAAPMLLQGATRLLWEHLRVPYVAVLVVLIGLFGVTITHAGHTRIGGGDLLPLVLSVAWIVGVGGLAIGSVLALPFQLREPGLPLPRAAPIPRWATPLVAVEATALFGLGLALLVKPAFWGPLLPWQVDDFDARMVGCWALALGVALLAALAEDDLVRLRGGLWGMTCIGGLALLSVGRRHAYVDWHHWPARLMLVLLVGLFATGVIGSWLERCARR